MEGYYDNCVFHRVIKGLMAQTGDPTNTGEGLSVSVGGLCAAVGGGGT